MTPIDKCPLCGSRKLVPAQFYNEVAAGSWLSFPEVEQFPWWKFASAGNKDDIRYLVLDKATACLGCGNLWAPFELPAALELVRRHGSAEMNAKLAAMDPPPPP